MVIRDDYTIVNTNGTIDFANPIDVRKIKAIFDLSSQVSRYDLPKLKFGIAQISSTQIQIKSVDGLRTANQLRIEYDEDSSGGGGGGGDASASNQVAQTNELIAIKNKIIASPATEATNLAILAELRDDVFIQSTIWEDRSATVSVFYREERIRSQDDGTITTIYTRLSDNVVVGSLPAGSIPVAGATDRVIEFYRWKAIANGTGYSIGDWLTNTIVFDTGGSGAVLSSTWYNLNTSATISTPTNSDLQDPNDQLLAVVGSQSDAQASSDTGTFSIVAFIKRILVGIATSLSNWNTLLGRTPPLVSGRVPVKNNLDAGDKDIFGALVTTARQPQISVQFNTAYLQSLVNITLSGGASGSVAPTVGVATLSSGTATTASISAISQNTVIYQSGSEVFAEFTADFTAPTNANSFQRIGLYNALNGFFVGYNALAFGIGSRLNGVDTHVAQGSFNIDNLTGTAGSLFTRNGVVEAVDFTKFNIYRVRFGWLGIAPAFFEVLSPDGVWVTFHKILFPNTALTASIATPNLPITLEISKTGSDATNLQISTGCWAGGITGTIVPQSSVPAPRNSQAVVVTPAQQQVFRTTFSKTIASGADAEFWNLIQIGIGQTVAQSGGNLVINAQTTTNSETIIRSNRSFTGSFTLRQQTTLSQRNANNNFFVELVDIIGDGLAVTVNSATSITVTFPATFLVDATFVGQSMYVGAFAGFTGVTALGGRYAIASVSGQNVTFTVASFVTGSVNTGTCSVFGWNYHQILYTGATATNLNYDSQRRGWNGGATVATINTTTTGHMAIMGSEDGNAFLADQLIASATTLPITTRASRVANIAEESTPLFLQIRSLNGNTAPTNTTWTIGMISVENFSTQPVNITSARAQGANTAQPVAVLNTPTVSGTVTANIGTGSLGAGTNLIGDVGQQYRASATGAGTPINLNCPATPVGQSAKGTAGRVIGFYAMNSNVTTVRWLKIFNVAAPTLGTTAAFLDIPIPPSNNPVFINFEGGIGFSTAIVVAITGAKGTTDNTAVTLNDVSGFLVFA